MTESKAIEALTLEGGLEISGKEKRVADFFAGLDVAISALKEVQQYREIGTVQECREAVEKQKAKNPRDIEYDYSYFICPTCGEAIYVSDILKVINSV